MTNDENVKNINETNEDVNQETSADAADAEETESTDMPNLDPHESADVLKLNNWLEELADKSSVKSQVFCYKTILVNQGKPSMWGMRLHFPGTFEAGQIETDAMDANGNMNLKKLMQNCIRAGVIISPKITDLEKFANTHEGFGEAVTQVLNFLNDGTNGKLR